MASLGLSQRPEIGADSETLEFGDLGQAIRDYEARDVNRTEIWLGHFTRNTASLALMFL